MNAKNSINEKIIIKKYKNRRLYNVETSDYITKDDLVILIREGRDVEIQEAINGKNVTVETLLQAIISEIEHKVPISSEFLHFLIRTNPYLLSRFFTELMPIIISNFKTLTDAWTGSNNFIPSNFLFSSFSPFWPFGSKDKKHKQDEENYYDAATSTVPVEQNEDIEESDDDDAEENIDVEELQRRVQELEGALKKIKKTKKN